MPVLMIQFGDMTPVDKMEEDEEGRSCPLATRNPEVNEENRNRAVEDYDYRDPADDGGFVETEVCGNCSYYNLTEDMMECVGDESGDTGYCQKLKFVCSGDMTCDKWEAGGPMKADVMDMPREAF